MSLEKRNCQICQNDSFILVHTCKDYSVSHEYFNIVRCTNCNFLYTNPIPDESTIGNFYKTSNYISHSNTSNGLINKLYKIIRNYTLTKKFKLITLVSNKKVGRLLDVGCGTGHFLNICRKKGWGVDGVEPDINAKNLAEIATKKLILSSINEINNEQKYDVITLWHVLEHVHSLNDTIIKLGNVLAKSGVVIIAVPNHESLDALIYKQNWAAYDVPRHLYHFSKQTLEILMKKHGFSLSGIKPMFFDSFYVSMISENNLNKNKFLGLFNAFINGLLSNMSKKNNHSSLIYIFNK